MILDASVVLKWMLNEDDSELALSLAGRAELKAPDILPVETAYVLTKMARQRKIAAEEAREAWFELSRADIALVGGDRLHRVAFDLSLRLAANYYDCLYLALAINEDDILVTADARFVRAVRTAPSLGRHIRSLTEAAA